MSYQITGIHHVTAIASNAQKNLDFYRNVLGLRLIKKTVNFDDPYIYHLYYGNQNAEPGSVLTFFPWENITKGRRGTGQATEIGLSVPPNSLAFWVERFKTHNVIFNNPSRRLDEEYLTLLDPDGLKIELVVNATDQRIVSNTGLIPVECGIRGFHSVAITLGDIEATSQILTDIFGYHLLKQEVNRYRFKTEHSSTANFIDLVKVPGEQQGLVAGGSVHHIAFRVPDENAHNYFRERIFDAGFNVTEQIDRQYFKAIYFREPGGVLFEVSTDTPGFAVDESMEELGKSLKLPNQYEVRRLEIEKKLPELN